MADVTVLGAGIFGLSVAFACQSRGARVQVIDPNGVGAGASGGVVGALAPHVPENWNAKKQVQFDSLLMAETFWHDVETISGMSPGYARLGRVQPVADEAALALARQRAKTAGPLWQGAATWQVIDAADAPWAPHSASGFVIFDTLSARLHPRRACAALAAAITARGGTITDDAPHRGRVLHATGTYDLDRLSATMGSTVGNGVKGQGALLHFDARDLPQIFAAGVHIVPHADGTTAIGSTSERVFDDPTSTDAQLDAVIEAAMTALPVLHGARVIERWAGVRPRSRSRAPMMGAHPLHKGHFIANGGFKIGFGIAPKLAELMAELMLEGRDGIPDDFRPEASL